MLTTQDALSCYRMLEQAAVRCWVMGGWGVDALLGRQTRPHHDLDLLVSFADLDPLHDLLLEHGFTRRLIWEAENRWVNVRGVRSPTAFVEADLDGRELDVHVIRLMAGRPPVPLCDVPWAFDDNSLEGVGSIGGAQVRCVSAATQLQMHTGYDLPPQHERDVDRLRLLVDPAHRHQQAVDVEAVRRVVR